MPVLRLSPGRLTLPLLRDLWTAPRRFAIDASARPAVDAAAKTVDRVIASGQTVYGVNTGFGLLAIVGAKLLLVDAAHAGTAIWTGTLIGVALLVIAASYFAPRPPAQN